jgi:hypothetical protein
MLRGDEVPCAWDAHTAGPGPDEGGGRGLVAVGGKA